MSIGFEGLNPTLDTVETHCLLEREGTKRTRNIIEMNVYTLFPSSLAQQKQISLIMKMKYLFLLAKYYIHYSTIHRIVLVMHFEI